MFMTKEAQAATAQAIEEQGFAMVLGVFTSDECLHIAGELQAALEACADEAASLRRANGAIYGARNLLQLYPPAKRLWQRRPLTDLLATVLGSNYGLVRGLYFDKPPDGNWSLPWHRDLTIAVADHSPPSERFKNPTRKAGVAHVEAPDEVLQRMLTLRIHLDDVTPQNGPLLVLPGTHQSRDAASTASEPVTILARAGDVLAMRPLLSHSSIVSQPGTTRHRRIIHLEFAAMRRLPDGYQWREFTPAIIA
jgi:hypothetical protein